jgi:acetyl-CoA carboxylase biotin carboxyl carrier protein
MRTATTQKIGKPMNSKRNEPASPAKGEKCAEPSARKAGMAGISSNQDIFDVRRIRRLVELMKEHDLGEIDLRQGETRIQLRRGGVATTSVAGAPVTVAVAPPAATSAAADAAVPAAPAAADAAHIAIIKSPMVGTFYTASDPDSPPYAKVGDHVGPDTTCCIVEAMKVFNQIPAEVSGKIVAVLVENGMPVEFGQPLFKVDTRG